MTRVPKYSVLYLYSSLLREYYVFNRVRGYLDTMRIFEHCRSVRWTPLQKTAEYTANELSDNFESKLEMIPTG